MDKGFIERQATAWTTYLDRFEVHGSETYSGWGSKVGLTKPIRDWLPSIFERYGIKTMLDAPCGDRNWIQHVDLTGIDYTGWDVEPFIIDHNRARFPDCNLSVVNLLTVDSVPKVDLILCRDFMIHLPNECITLVLEKFKASGSRYLAATHYPGAPNDASCPLDGGDENLPGYYCRPINLEAAPFSLAGRIEGVPEFPGGSNHELALFDLGQT
ncbi:hypothetical protein [Mycolicibacter kumamotonensis]|uniref:hypothetical protein n=1 Tax=Mycolicibacter kumamotonensis TaxID=354243 RepID=UPI0008066AE4|nr:hypothetical protein [Mycolicibacter kumamotonensis]